MSLATGNSYYHEELHRTVKGWWVLAAGPLGAAFAVLSDGTTAVGGHEADDFVEGVPAVSQGGIAGGEASGGRGDLSGGGLADFHPGVAGGGHPSIVAFRKCRKEAGPPLNHCGQFGSTVHSPASSTRKSPGALYLGTMALIAVMMAATGRSV